MKICEVKKLLDASPVDAYRISEKRTESHELFFVHEKIETVRSTDTVDVTVTVYVDHDGKRGDSSFAVSGGMNEDDVVRKIGAAAQRAKLVFNEPYELPEAGSYEKTLGGNLAGCGLAEAAEQIAEAVFAAPKAEGCSLNALEVFVYRETLRVVNDRGVDKTAHLVRSAVEAIPTYTDDSGSVELYEMIKFTDLDRERIMGEISEKMREVKDRATAKAPGAPLKCGIVLRPYEIGDLIWELADDLGYGNVYSKANLRVIGDDVQKGSGCDRFTVRAKAAVRGSDKSAFFDGDGTDLCDTLLIEDGKVKNYYGSSRFGQYLGVKKPSGVLNCISLAPGTLGADDLKGVEYLEIASMSGIQVDLFNDYLGGEIRLAYLVRGGERTPVTGVSFSARLSEVLENVRLSKNITVEDDYEGPDFMYFEGAEII